MQSELSRSHDCETAGPALREILGCDKPRARECAFEFGGYVIDRCPAHYTKSASGWILWANEIYGHREKGIMPFVGGYLDQPNKIVEMCGYLDYIFSEKLKMETR